MTTKAQMQEDMNRLQTNLDYTRREVVSLRATLESNRVIMAAYEKHFLHLGRNTQSMAEAISSAAHMLTDIRVGKISQR